MGLKLNRRQALGSFGTVSLGALLAGCREKEQSGTTDTQAKLLDEGNSCKVTTELTEGPYYFDAGAIRRDIREDREGVRLRLVLRVREANGCTPISNAVVDVWHSDAQGLYSGFEAASRSAGGGDGSRSDDERYLRGAQVTNDDGVIEFETIYPGWYQGRTPHIHAKVHLDKRTLLTTQLFFDEQLVTGVYRDKRYSRDSKREVTNSSDSIFDESLVLTLRRQGAGWVGAMTVDVERA